MPTGYVQAEPPKPAPPVPVRVSRRSQLMAALRQNKHPIVIEDQDLAQPFVRLLRTRDMKTAAARAIVAEIASYAIRRSYGSDIEAHWHIGGYVLPGNVDPQIEGAPTLRPPGHETISSRNALATRLVAAMLCRGRSPCSPRSEQAASRDQLLSTELRGQRTDHK